MKVTSKISIDFEIYIIELIRKNIINEYEYLLANVLVSKVGKEIIGFHFNQDTLFSSFRRVSRQFSFNRISTKTNLNKCGEYKIS